MVDNVASGLGYSLLVVAGDRTWTAAALMECWRCERSALGHGSDGLCHRVSAIHHGEWTIWMIGGAAVWRFRRRLWVGAARIREDGMVLAMADLYTVWDRWVAMADRAR
ncbi:hypothetical protein ACLOJK_013511 [Asimina triloba]